MFPTGGFDAGSSQIVSLSPYCLAGNVFGSAMTTAKRYDFDAVTGVFGLFIDPTPRLPLLVNWTPSLPYHVALMQFQQRPVRRGDLIVFAFAGEAQAHYRGLRGQPFFKRVRGVPGDVVTVSDRTVFVNGEAVGRAKTHAYDGHPLAPIAPVVIPPGHYYVQGIGLHSFDSRYAESGLVRDGQVLGIVQPIF